MPNEKIDLSRGKFATVDLEDFLCLKEVKWHVVSDRRGVMYAARNIPHPIKVGKRTLQLMHRVIAGATPDLCVDHINGDTLDNRRCNLRVCTRSQNACNSRKHVDSKNPYKGIIRDRKTQKWVAQIRIPGVKGSAGHKNLGYYLTPEEAHQAYLAAAKELHGEFMRGY